MQKNPRVNSSRLLGDKFELSMFRVGRHNINSATNLIACQFLHNVLGNEIAQTSCRLFTGMTTIYAKKFPKLGLNFPKKNKLGASVICPWIQLPTSLRMWGKLGICPWMSLNWRINVLEKFKKCPGMSLNLILKILSQPWWNWANIILCTPFPQVRLRRRPGVHAVAPFGKVNLLSTVLPFLFIPEVRRIAHIVRRSIAQFIRGLLGGFLISNLNFKRHQKLRSTLNCAAAAHNCENTPKIPEN